MAERRTISDAVDLTPKHEAFIKGGVPSESTPTAEVGRGGTPRRAEADTIVEMPRRTQARRRVRRQTEAASEEKGSVRGDESAAILDDILVPLTTKLKRRTVQALRRAYLEQKLDGRKPATQQEIIEEAVGQWLRRNDFEAA